jgi:hypothetical protein
MNVAEVLQAATISAKKAKVISARQKQIVLPTSVVCFRGGVPVAMVQRDVTAGSAEVVTMTTLAANGFGADLIVVTVETWFAVGELAGRGTNPVTGNRYQRGDMQDLVENHHGRERGWVLDAIVITVADRDGHQETELIPFKPRGRQVEWIEVEELNCLDAHPDSTELDGFMKDQLHSIMMQETKFTEAFPLDPDDNPEMAQAAADCMIAKSLTMPPASLKGLLPECEVALVCEEGSLRERTIKEFEHHLRIMHPDPEMN